MLSKLATSRYPGGAPTVVRLPTFSARNRIAPMPMVTNRPTHRSSVERFMDGPRANDTGCSCVDPAEHENGEHEIQREDHERALDDGARGRAGDALGRRIGVVTFEHGDQADRAAE